MSNVSYYTFIETDEFIVWLEKLKDPIGKAGVTARLARARRGNFGDHKPLSSTGGVCEMRIFKGNGYRVYYARKDDKVYVLLLGGSKDGQQADIAKAVIIWADIQAEMNDENL